MPGPWYTWEDREQGYDFSEIEKRLALQEAPLSELALDDEEED
jgi:hypothetical protein